MTLEEILTLPISQIAAPDCWLLLWTPWPHLIQALEVMRAWNFKYCSNAFVWVKQRRGSEGDLFGVQPCHLAMGLGYTTRKASEPCLLGRHGSPRRKAKNLVDVILAPVREHSRKPEEAYERAEAYVEGPRLDLFARQRRPGWDAWGDQLDMFPPAPHNDVGQRELDI